MPVMLNLGPATEQVAALLPGVDDRQLQAQTPCPDYVVSDLLDHLMGLTEEFHRAATKDTVPTKDTPASAPPEPAGANLSPDWRSELPIRLKQLAEAWRNPAAWRAIPRPVE